MYDIEKIVSAKFIPSGILKVITTNARDTLHKDHKNINSV